MKLLIKQEYATYYLQDDSTEEILYGGAAVIMPYLFIRVGRYKQEEEKVHLAVCG